MELTTRKIGKISLNTSKVPHRTSMKGSMLLTGTIHEGRRKVAVKRVVDSITNYDEVLKHIRLSEEKQHENVIRYFLVEHETNFYYIALEWCHGTLKELVEKIDFDRGGLTDIEVARQITSGLNHIHSCGIVHLDLKPSNVLITKSSETTNRVVITDLDVSKYCEEGKSLRTFTYSGSEGWIAPEVSGIYYQNHLSSKVDIFVLGCLFYYIITNGLHPFHDQPNSDNRVCQKNINLYSKEEYILRLRSLDKNTPIGLLAEDLLVQLLDKNPKLRPDALTCLQHPVFWDSLKQRKFIQASGDLLRHDIDNRFHQRLEKHSQIVIEGEWNVGDPAKELVSSGRYNTKCLSDLLLFVRDQYAHLWKQRAVMPSFHSNTHDDYNLLEDVNERYPSFLRHIYHAAVPWRHDDKFKEFYPKDDSYIKIWDDLDSTQLMHDMSCVWEAISDLQISNIEEKCEFRGIAMDNQRRLLIADSGLHCVNVLEEGILTPVVMNASPFDKPVDVAVDQMGNIAVSDTGKNAVFVFSKEGNHIKTISDAEGKTLREPNGVAFSASGKLVVCDSLNHRVVIYSEFNFELAFGKKGRRPGQFDIPWMVTVDDNDMLFITDAANHRVQVFTIQGRFCYTIGSKGSGELQFSEPTGIVPFQDCFLVTDFMNKRVQVIAKTEKQFVGSIGPHLEGDTRDFSRVWGVACEKTDQDSTTFYVADYGRKSRIVKLRLRVKKTAKNVPVPKEHEEV